MIKENKLRCENCLGLFNQFKDYLISDKLIWEENTLPNPSSSSFGVEKHLFHLKKLQKILFYVNSTPYTQ